ncbi:microfibril-associated glycoprotein 4-like [Argopecten irradians]|uniref:microfibril-associated glycoprotein 4-like n=1 Tax=Argopecten irradians TaxID=31199 RepID=UPI00371D6960
MALVLAILVVFCVINEGVASPPSCFSCSGITQARYCDFYTQCDEGEVCFVEKTENQNGHFKYTSGCMHNSTCETLINDGSTDRSSSIHEHSVCRDCCHGDMCNNKGCGDHGPSNTRGPYCFQCDHLSDPSECDHVTICDINEVCGVVEEIFQHYIKNLVIRKKMTLHQNTTTPSTQTTPLVTTITPAILYRDCNDHYRAGSVKSGIYTISPDDVNTFDVYCDMEDGDGGWIVLQHRFDGSVLFNRSFSDYENGFGRLDGEFWLGLKKMYILAHSNLRVRFNLQALNGTWLALEYGQFSISNASLQYTLHVANHTDGFAACSFGYNNGHRFATYDKDTENCANSRFGGWWYNHCTYFNINGHFGLNNERGVTEYCSLGRYIRFQKTLMMIQ